MTQHLFSLYVHIPYCQTKCPYCDFNSHAALQWPETRYTDALCREIAHFGSAEPWRDGRLGTIFFGGGTPSLFEPASIKRIVDAALATWPRRDPSDTFEITAEANPGTVTEAKLAGFLDAGVNRMSFGVQSFADHHLRTLGRLHDSKAGIRALRNARSAGFENMSLDLMFALPQQLPAEWAADLQQACALEPEHISAYNLTYEEGTPFLQWRDAGRLQAQPEEHELEMFNEARTVLGAAGYAQYEISNYARPGRECGHNLNYWHSGPYLGVGAGAHSLSGGDDTPDGRWGQRWSNRKSPGLYMADIEERGRAVDWSESRDEIRARGEFVFLGLRCLEGFPASEFEHRFGCDLETAFPHASGLRGDGLLRLESGRWALTERGVLLGDSVFATFV